MSDQSCPCASGLDYQACCAAWHKGGSAPTAEALMRSRYSAFLRKDVPYLIRTSHPLLRAKVDVRLLRQSLALDWCGLEVVAVSGGGPDDQAGEVHFRARFRHAGQEQVHEERSRFVRIDGEWVYRDDRGTLNRGASA